MRVNADFDQRVAVTPDEQRWCDSPEHGVSRCMLDRVGTEIARATSLVRYAAGAGFHAHTHGGGEEIFVLEGVFSDEHGDYPAGSYLRNPPGSSHRPFSQKGCLLFVKLRQFLPNDDVVLRMDTRTAAWQRRADVSHLNLHTRPGEQVWLERRPAGQVFTVGGSAEERLIVSGEVRCGAATYPAQSWLRLPPGAVEHWLASKDCCLYVKRLSAGFPCIESTDAD